MDIDKAFEELYESWAVEFNEPNVKFYLFVLHVSQTNSNYKDLWMVFEPSEMKRASSFTTNYNYQSAYIHAYKTTMRPNGFAAKNSCNALLLSERVAASIFSIARYCGLA